MSRLAFCLCSSNSMTIAHYVERKRYMFHKIYPQLQLAVTLYDVTHLFRLGRLLGLVQNGLQTFVESVFDCSVLWWRVVLQQPQQLHRKPGRGHEVIRVVLQICVR